VAYFPALGKDEVQERDLQRSQGAPAGRHRIPAPQPEAVFLNAWTKTPKGWKFIAWQSTPQPATQMGSDRRDFITLLALANQGIE
jgi:hypothetical protein